MTTTEPGKFVLSYSGGKDGVLACHRAVNAGGKAVGALTTFDRENECSWFHRLPENVLKQVEHSLGIPLTIVDTQGNRYAADFESALKTLQSEGVDSVVFGDIDIRDHFDWCDERCRNVGLKSVFPLWSEDRKEIVHEMIEAGFLALITIVDTSRMNAKFLGKTLTKEIVAQIETDGVDPCGENGEYHTFVYDGPLFRRRIEITTGNSVQSEKHVYLPLR